MSEAQKPHGVKRRTIRGDSPSRRPPPAGAPAAPSPPPEALAAFDEAPTVARGTPALAAPATRSDHPTLLGVPPPPPEAPAPALEGPAFTAPQRPPWTAAHGATLQRHAPRLAGAPSSLRGALAAAFAVALLAALVASKVALDARAQSHAERRRPAAPSLEVGLPATPPAR